MNVAAACLLATILARGASAYPHSGNPCQDACSMVKMTCEKDCQKKAKERSPKAAACPKACKEQVASCQNDCPADIEQAQEKMRERGEKPLVK